MSFLLLGQGTEVPRPRLLPHLLFRYPGLAEDLLKGADGNDILVVNGDNHFHTLQIAPDLVGPLSPSLDWGEAVPPEKPAELPAAQPLQTAYGTSFPGLGIGPWGPRDRLAKMLKHV